MPNVPNTIADFRRWLLGRMNELDRLYEHPDPDEFLWSRCLDIVNDAAELASRRGMVRIVERSHSYDGGTGPRETKVFLSECLADLALQSRIPDPIPPYFSGEQAADYLGITMAQLYRQVEDRHITPLRGPGRRYRFTRDMLDGYLHATQR